MDIFSLKDKTTLITGGGSEIGKVPSYRETFIDDGDLNMAEIIRILKKNHYEGVLIPDHTPQMACLAPWYAGMAHALGYLKGLTSTI